jgi:muramoyltetrapeptide carboxypeptidase
MTFPSEPPSNRATASSRPLAPARLPPPVEPGDRVGVAALSGPVDPDRLEAGLEVLRELGFEPVEARNLRSKSGLFAGDDAERLDAFHELAGDPGLRAILFARGGHGVLRLLPAIDWELLARYPRAYVGYSDLTPFLGQVVERLGWVAFHGPMVAADLARGLAPRERESFLGGLAGQYPAHLPLASASAPATGVLRGGCLSLLVAALGTPYAQRLAGTLLVVEDVAEPLYRLDRMLTQLGLSGTLGQLGGMIFGCFSGTPTAAGVPPIECLLEAMVPTPGLPVATGLEAGHEPINLTLPLGLTAQIEPESRLLIVGP